MTAPVLSILVLVRNTREGAALCLTSLLETVGALGLGLGAAEFILIDDFSDADAGIVGLFKEVRAAAAATQSDVRIVRFNSHKHYAYGLAVGLSMARGSNVLFVSHDMVVPPACVRMLLAVAQADASVGIVRPVSAHMDGAPTLQLAPPAATRLRDIADVAAFSRWVARYNGLATFAPALFIGDAMLITRACINRVGVFDTRFFGFMGDVDYGVRARRSGLGVVAASGAWLHHEGSGFRKNFAHTAGADAEKKLADQIRADAAAAWDVFREKWDPSLPVEGKSLNTEQVRRLHESLPASQFDMRQPPIEIDPHVCEVH